MNSKLFCSLIVLCTLLELGYGNDLLPPPCSSPIYCHGPFLHLIQTSAIYHDSKTFVDLKMKRPPNETMQLFYDFIEESGAVPDRLSVELFVNRTFEPAGSEFEDWEPNDWIEKPAFLDANVKDPTIREWGFKLNSLWKFLGRKMKTDVFKNPDLYSIIWVPHPVIVPGGRFREFYYWDSYWIVKGLLLSEMHSTAKGMLENFFFIVEKYGFIPNGGRIYYSRRSQPPLLIPMVHSYYEYTKDIDFLKTNIGTMEKEFDFWIKNHTVTVQKNGKNYTLAIFGDQSSGPRPESYREDIESARGFETDEKKESYYAELKAAAESGWDFSSRWFITNATNKGNLTNLHTRDIVPVDLNAIIYGNAVMLADFFQILNDTVKTIHYKKIASQWLDSVTDVLWHEDVGTWLDYDMKNNVRRNYFYPTNIAPLWTGCYDESRKENVVRHVMDYLKKQNIFENKGGIPSSFEHTGEQWDFPNAWPPLQHMMIVGLQNTGDVFAQALAYEITLMWIRSNYKAYDETTAMFEKYDATVFGGHGYGGEYEIQLGFGWTNGIVLDLMNTYGSKLTLDVDDNYEDLPEYQPTVSPREYSNGGSITTTFSQVVTGLLALLISLTTGFIGIVIYKKRSQGAINVKNKIFNRKHYTELRNIPKDKNNFS